MRPVLLRLKRMCVLLHYATRQQSPGGGRIHRAVAPKRAAAVGVGGRLRKSDLPTGNHVPVPDEGGLEGDLHDLPLTEIARRAEKGRAISGRARSCRVLDWRPRSTMIPSTGSASAALLAHMRSGRRLHGRPTEQPGAAQGIFGIAQTLPRRAQSATVRRRL